MIHLNSERRPFVIDMTGDIPVCARQLGSYSNDIWHRSLARV